MNQLLFDRATGSLDPQSFARVQTASLIHATQLSMKIRFDGSEKETTVSSQNSSVHSETQIDEGKAKIWAHQLGVNALTIEKFNGKILISGGADSSIKLWDLEQIPHNTKATLPLRPYAAVPRTVSSHQYGITHLSFYPFDSGAFLSSSYDHHLKLYSTETLQLSADFDLEHIVYHHALSPKADHLLVACATEYPAVRLTDLRTGARTHSLAGHRGAVLNVCWHPTIGHILASAGVDGTVRVWDVRKSSGSLGVLNLEDPTGIVGCDGLGQGARQPNSGKAHDGPVNGLKWTDDGKYVVSAGHDERIRVWDAATGANTLASFGPMIKNRHPSHLPLLLSATNLTAAREELFFYPNEKELLVFELHEGKLLKRLRVPGPVANTVRSSTGARNARHRFTSLARRNQVDGIYSGHTDGQIRAWIPRTKDDETEDVNEEEERSGRVNDEEGPRRKRQPLNDVFRDLTRQRITFG
ncbi:WD40-repeat-containing domain protein [Calycina marina]|uniref:WD40-repeat-containing domain protein n=1 Tax=Calycina marina TaxID=1763456 RepID=A0A9P8CJC6_9HELO|nr:WD40-repeat-containing domain protein [Calycina marina]